ncbi:MAG: branched-chain amino acid aminotransferase [Flavobacteriales bacterium]|nr:branched-chain amino acid aminotransferase [Flavobacteriales bacterium]
MTTSSTENSVNIKISQTEATRVGSVDFHNIPFGKVFSDHMFLVDYKDGEWSNPVIRPFGNLSLSPAISALHYGQAIFEGMKAYKDVNGIVKVFRPEANYKRFNKSAERMCMPQLPKDLFMDALNSLLTLDSAWVPPVEGCALYVRPVMFATTAEIKVRTADEFIFAILTCPVGPYYPEPVRVVIETHFARAMEGGIGFAKAAGNYGAALYPAKQAQEKGYDQLIWTDAKEHKYIEESGTMNIMFLIDGKLHTPSLETNTILEGITRDSVMQIARSKGIEVLERRILVEEIVDYCRSGECTEAFGVGTAATIAPIATIGYEGEDFQLKTPNGGSVSKMLMDELSGIRTGKIRDEYGWMVPVN